MTSVATLQSLLITDIMDNGLIDNNSDYLKVFGSNQLTDAFMKDCLDGIVGNDQLILAPFNGPPICGFSWGAWTVDHLKVIGGAPINYLMDNRLALSGTGYANFLEKVADGDYKLESNQDFDPDLAHIEGLLSDSDVTEDDKIKLVASMVKLRGHDIPDNVKTKFNTQVLAYMAEDQTNKIALVVPKILTSIGAETYDSKLTSAENIIDFLDRYQELPQLFIKLTDLNSVNICSTIDEIFNQVWLAALAKSTITYQASPDLGSFVNILIQLCSQNARMISPSIDENKIPTIEGMQEDARQILATIYQQGAYDFTSIKQAAKTAILDDHNSDDQLFRSLSVFEALADQNDQDVLEKINEYKKYKTSSAIGEDSIQLLAQKIALKLEQNN